MDRHEQETSEAPDSGSEEHASPANCKGSSEVAQAADAAPRGEWKISVEEFSFSGCHYNSSCD